MTERSLLALAILGVVGLAGCGTSTTDEGAPTLSDLSSPSSSVERPVVGSGPLAITVENSQGQLCVTVAKDSVVTEDHTGCVGPKAVTSVGVIIALTLDRNSASSDYLDVVALPPGSTNIDVLTAGSRWWIAHVDDSAVVVVVYPIHPDEVGKTIVDLSFDGRSYSCGERVLPSDYVCNVDQ